MIAELAKAASLLLSLCLVYALIAQRWQRDEVVGKVLAGLVFGLVCIIGMESPVVVLPGVIFDARSVVLSLSGVFGGPVAGVIAGVVAGGYRAYLGGGGAPVGIAVIAASAAMGIAFHHLHKRGRLPFGFLNFLIFGLAVHLVAIGIFTRLPGDVVDHVMSNVALPFVLIFTPATAVLGEIFRFVDEQIETRKALARNEARLRAIVDNTPNGMNLKDRDGRIIVANPTYAEWMGLGADALVGKWSRDLYPEKVARAIEDKDRQVLDSGEALIEEVAHKFPAAGRKALRYHKIPIVLDGDENLAVLTIMVDLTSDKMAQRELRLALDTAEEASKAKTRFLATMSHELRTPLNAIIGFSEIIYRQYLGAPDNVKYREYAKDIYSSASYLLSLVEDLLDVSAIEAGAAPLEPAEVSVAAIARECAEAMHDRAVEKEITIHLDIPDGLPMALGDARALKQILLNLLGNAVKFTDSAGEIGVSARDKGASLEISVFDNGPGIEPELLERLLRPFERASHNPYTSEKGWGLGLSITNSLIDLQDGEMRIESTPGQGTRVIFTLPSAGPAAVHLSGQAHAC